MGKLDRPDGMKWDAGVAASDCMLAMASGDVSASWPMGHHAAAALHTALQGAYNTGAADGAGAVISATHADRDKRALADMTSAALLCALDVACFLPPERLEGPPRLALICNDTFGYAVADCEAVALEDAPKFLKLWDTEGWPGIVRYIAMVRGSQPILEVQASMAGADPVFQLIRRERERQDAKWGVQNHVPLKWQAILAEECGEVAKAVLEDDDAGYLNELVQVAAVAVSAVQCCERNERGHGFRMLGKESAPGTAAIDAVRPAGIALLLPQSGDALKSLGGPVVTP